MKKFSATLVITTKNRCEELRRALTSAIAQTGIELEILVIDDGSTDGTSEMVRSEFPTVRLERREESGGLISRRNEGARLAQQAPVADSSGYIVGRNEGADMADGEIIFSIDDDAEFSSPDTVAQVLAEFSHPRIGAVAIPFVNVHQSPRIFQQATLGGPEIQVKDSYIGTAHAVRRELFLTLGGYREHLIHQGEEGDFCIRLLAAGYVVRLGKAAPISHYESPKRDTRRMDFYGRRNDVLYAWHNVPWPYLPVHLLGTIANGLKTATKAKHSLQMFRGLLAGCLGCFRFAQERKPVSAGIYRLTRRLKNKGPLDLEEIEKLLPPLCSKVARQ